MPRGVFDAAISRHGQQVVITGGVTQSGAASNLVQVFDPSNLKWTLPLRLPQGLCMHTQVTLADSRILIAGGCTGQLPRNLKVSPEAYLLDLQTQQVIHLQPLPRPTQYPTAHLLPDGKAVVIGGRNAMIFDPATNAWMAAIRLRQTRKGHASIVLADGRILVAGGGGRSSIEVIDPHADGGGISQMLKAQLPWPIDDLRMTQLLDGRVLILGGQSCLNGNTTDQSWILDLRDPKVSRIADGPRLGIAGGVADHCIQDIGPWVVVAGGEAQQAGHDIELASARLLNRQTLAVWSLPLMSQPHDDAVSISTQRGVIVFGGYLVKSMSFPQLPGLTVPGVHDTTLPEISVPFAGAAVERLTLPEALDAAHRPRYDGRNTSAAAAPSASTDR